MRDNGKSGSTFCIFAIYPGTGVIITLLDVLQTNNRTFEEIVERIWTIFYFYLPQIFSFSSKMQFC